MAKFNKTADLHLRKNYLQEFPGGEFEYDFVPTGMAKYGRPTVYVHDAAGCKAFDVPYKGVPRIRSRAHPFFMLQLADAQVWLSRPTTMPCMKAKRRIDAMMAIISSWEAQPPKNFLGGTSGANGGFSVYDAREVIKWSSSIRRLKICSLDSAWLDSEAHADPELAAYQREASRSPADALRPRGICSGGSLTTHDLPPWLVSANCPAALFALRKLTIHESTLHVASVHAPLLAAVGATLCALTLVSWDLDFGALLALRRLSVCGMSLRAVSAGRAALMSKQLPRAPAPQLEHVELVFAPVRAMDERMKPVRACQGDLDWT
ncbi:hypothetical protein HDZ31DRAFT_65505 [Schizophyllum fasciatum]